MRFIYVVFFVTVLFFSCDQKKEAKQADASKENVTTYYFVRHAEKDLSDPTNRNPELTEKGKQRAQEWMVYFKNKDIDAVYSTNYERTMNTALPIANDAGLLISNYNPAELYTTDFQAATKGQNVVVVGHSNTNPSFVNKIIGENRYQDIDESEYGHLYTVTVKNGKASVAHKEFD